MHTSRRLRRFLPAAVAAVTLAASAPLVGAPAAHAHTHRPAPRTVAVQAAGTIPTLPRASTTRGIRVEGTSAT
jgi:hypothetical protein